jgi:hypothetical protein
MFLYVKITTDKDKNSTAYHCASCGAFITDSASWLTLNGSVKHSFVNPARVRCDFMTFIDCDNIQEHDELFMEHSWFPGYGWRFITCRICFQHLGWKYDAVTDEANPSEFFGVLISSVKTLNHGE